jgi:hypothetical protein
MSMENTVSIIGALQTVISSKTKVRAAKSAFKGIQAAPKENTSLIWKSIMASAQVIGVKQIHSRGYSKPFIETIRG